MQTDAQILMRMNGPVVAVGAHQEDKERLKNLRQLIATTRELLEKIEDAARSKNNPQASMKEIGETAQQALIDIGNDYCDTEGQINKEVDRWMEAIRQLVIERSGAEDFHIDGTGCDSSDPLDVTMAEIGLGFNHLQDIIDGEA